MCIRDRRGPEHRPHRDIVARRARPAAGGTAAGPLAVAHGEVYFATKACNFASSSSTHAAHVCKSTVVR
eukprot:5938738-Prymnesium_polylepis.1